MVGEVPVQRRPTDPDVLGNVLAGVTVRLHPRRGSDVLGIVDFAWASELGAVGTG